MPVWLTIVLALGGSAIITFLVNLIGNYIVNGRKAKQRRIEEIENQHQKDRDQMKEDIKEIVTELNKTLEPLKRGSQQLLRSELNKMYLEAKKKGYSSAEDKALFEDLYQSYEALGENGVMSQKHDYYMELDFEKKSTKNK